MARVGIRIKIDQKTLQTRLEEIRKRATTSIPRPRIQRIADNVKRMVLNEVLRGISPVRDQGRYKRYSDSYEKQIKSKAFRRRFGNKRKRPVNLRLTGEMLRSLVADAIQNGIRLYYDDPEMALRAEANEELGRKILPDEDERFIRRIEREIQTQLTKVIERTIRTI